MKILSYVELCSLDGTMLLVNKADVITRLNFYNIKENFMLEEYGIFRKTYSSNGFDLIFNSKEEFEITTRMHHVGHSDIETYCNEHVIGKIVVGFEDLSDIPIYIPSKTRDGEKVVPKVVYDAVRMTTSPLDEPETKNKNSEDIQ